MFLGHAQQYHRTIRNVLIAFGTIFKDLELVKYAKDSRDEISRITVPIEIGAKETYFQRLDSDPETLKGIQVKIPLMSYDMVGELIFDDLRQLSDHLNTQVSQDSILGVGTKMPIGAPYIMPIELMIYVRNQEDGFQLVEQILPYFTPDYTISMKYASTAANCVIVNDVMFNLNTVSRKCEYEGPAGTVRYIYWTLEFEARFMIYPPTDDGTGPIIKQAIANIRDYDSEEIQVEIVVQPDPLTANSTDAWTANTTIKDFDQLQ